MKKHILSTIIFLAGTTLQMYAPRPFENIIDSHANDATTSHTQEAQAPADAAAKTAAEHATSAEQAQAKLTGEHVRDTVTNMGVHDIVAQVNSEFGGKLKLQDQSNLASAIDNAQKSDQGVQELDNLLTAFAEKYNPNQGRFFNSKDFLTGLKTAERGKSLSDQISSAFNYVKLQFSHAANYVNPKGASIDPKNLLTKTTQQTGEMPPEPANRQTGDVPVTQPNSTGGFEPLLEATAATTAHDHAMPTPDTAHDAAAPITTAALPAKMPEGLKISSGYNARLVDETGTEKVALNIDSIVSGLITSITSSAHPITIAQKISTILVASSKPDNQIAPFSETEISTLGSYMNQMKNPTYAAQAQHGTMNIAFKMGGLHTTERPDLQKMATDAFNDYLSDLLNARSTNLNQKQLLESIKKAEQEPRGLVTDGIKNMRMNTVLASLPYISESHKATEASKGIVTNTVDSLYAQVGLTSSHYQAPITLSSPIPMLPEKVPGVSSLEDFTKFRVALTDSLRSMNPTEAKALVTKLIGNPKTEYVHKSSTTIGQKIAMRGTEIAMGFIQPHLDSFQQSIQKGALPHEAAMVENPFGQLLSQAAAHPAGQAAAQLVGQVGGNTLSKLVDNLTGNSESTYLSTFLNELSNSLHITDLTANTEAQLNGFLQKISSDPYHPMKLTDENFSQISRNLISMFNETFKPILDAEEPTQGGLTNETRKNEQRNYKKSILSNLETKPVTDATSLATFSDKIFADFKLTCENPKSGILSTDLSANAIATNLLTSSFSNEPRLLAFDAMAILLAPADGSLATQANVFENMNYLDTFFNKPTFNKANETLINNILINLKSELRLTAANCADISSSLASLKPIIITAHFDPGFNPFPVQKIPSEKIETQASKVVKSLAPLIPLNARESERIPAIKDILTTFYTTNFSGPLTSKAELRVQILNDLMANKTAIYNISNTEARTELINNITTLKTFLETPSSTEDSKNNQIINNILRKLGVSITLTPSISQSISESLSPLKPLLDTALTWLNKPIPSIALPESKSPGAPAKPAEAPFPATPTPELNSRIERVESIDETPSPAGTNDRDRIESINETPASSPAGASVSGSAVSLLEFAPAHAEALPPIKPISIDQTIALSKASKAIGKGITSPDKALTTMNNLLTTPEERYDLSDPSAKKALIEHMKGLIEIINNPELIMKEENVIYINTLLKNMGSDLIITPENSSKIALALTPLKDLIQIAIQPTPATSTWASYVGWK